MALILTRKSAFASWYEKNKKGLSEKRKKRYAEDPVYRQRALDASRKRRSGERSLPIPPDAPISFAEAAARTGIGVSTLNEWRRKEYFPEPKLYKGNRWFSEKQLLLLSKLKEVIRLYGKRRGNVKRDRLREIVASISADWT